MYSYFSVCKLISDMNFKYGFQKVYSILLDRSHKTKNEPTKKKTIFILNITLHDDSHSQSSQRNYIFPLNNCSLFILK